MFDKFFAWVIKKREPIITFFKLYYIFLSAVLIFGGVSIYSQNDSSLWFYSLGVNSGRAALIFYILTTIPGITRRFGIRHKLISTLMIFRRYIGISVYMHVLIHFSFVRGIYNFFINQNFLDFSFFEKFGFASLILLTPLFVSSNDWSVKYLRIWWDRIHKLTYIIIFLILTHVVLQRISFWSVLLGMTLILQVASFVWAKMVKKTRI